MSLPRPEPGLVVRYAYLWLHEHLEGREEGTKDRPCAIVLAALQSEDDTRALVVPITHRDPGDDGASLELPPNIKRHLGLDAARSWVILSESSVFQWPGPDLRRVGDRDETSVAYGFLPPRFFAEVKRRFLALNAAGTAKPVRRTD